jgi:hypothetical protein
MKTLDEQMKHLEEGEKALLEWWEKVGKGKEQ